MPYREGLLGYGSAGKRQKLLSTPFKDGVDLQWPTHDCLPHFSYLLKPMGLGGGVCWSPVWWDGNSAQQPSETKSSYCGATVSKVAPAGLPRSEIIGPEQDQTFALSSGHPGQAIGGDPIPLIPLTKS